MHSPGGATIGPTGLDELLKFRTVHCGHIVYAHLLLFQQLDKEGAVATFDEVVVVEVVLAL